jgi:hypothetical protein
MKNIHVLPAEKPSRLFEILQFCFVFDNQNKYSEEHKKLHKYKNKNIYITNDSEIEAGDYWIYICPINGLDYGDNNNPIVKNNLPTTWFEKLHDKENYKKIILTTDQDLIADGVDAIDDEFLEWFVKNPSCEYVETYSLGVKNELTGKSCHYKYETYLPHIEYKRVDSEIKHETLEEAAIKEGLLRCSQHNYNQAEAGYNAKWFKRGAIFGAKWQAQKMYTKDDVLRAGKIGEINHHDYKHIVSLLDEAKKINN